MGGPIALGLLFAMVVWLPLDSGWAAWARDAFCVLLAGAVGWRIAYYVHLHAVDHYGGAYTPPEVHAPALRRYRIAAPLYALATAAAGIGVLWWRGLP